MIWANTRIDRVFVTGRRDGIIFRYDEELREETCLLRKWGIRGFSIRRKRSCCLNLSIRAKHLLIIG